MSGDTLAFSMPSNSGNCTTTWTWSHRPGPGVAAFDVHLARAQPFLVVDDAEPIPGSSVTLTCVAISWARLAILRRHLAAWFTTAASFTVPLTEDSSLALTVSLAPDERRISSVTKPVFDVRCVDGLSFEAGWSYIVDQSCVRIMLVELEAVMSACGAHDVELT